MDEIEVQGLRIAYERAGDGPPVALAHGFVGTGTSTWAAQIDALSRDYTVVAWDAPGAGRSSDPPAEFRAEDYADCWVAFLGALGLSHAHLVGLSFGGIVALSVVERQPAVPTSLALVGAYAGWRGSLPAAEVEERLSRCLQVSELAADEFARAMVPSMFSATPPESAVAGFMPSVRDCSRAGFRTMARASAEADLRHVLPRVEVPTLLLYGDEDARAPLHVAEQLRTTIPGSRLVVLPGVGHASPVEAPDAVSTELRRFLESVQGEDGDGARRSSL